MPDDTPPDPQSEAYDELAAEPEIESPRHKLSLFWKIGVGFAVVLAAATAAGIGAAIVRLSCETNCTVPYVGGVGLGIAFGGVGTLILAVLVARSMQEWTEYRERQETEDFSQLDETDSPG